MNDTSKTPATGGGPDGPKDEFSFTRGMDFFLVWLAWLVLIVLADEKARLLPPMSGATFPVVVGALAFAPAWLSVFVWLHYFREMPRAEATQEAGKRATNAAVILILAGIAYALLKNLLFR
ncbi:MAG: hypothetical protein U1F24_01295 [Alphaproteobacteria bacterium]